MRWEAPSKSQTGRSRCGATVFLQTRWAPTVLAGRRSAWFHNREVTVARGKGSCQFGCIEIEFLVYEGRLVCGNVECPIKLPTGEGQMRFVSIAILLLTACLGVAVGVLLIPGPDSVSAVSNTVKTPGRMALPRQISFHEPATDLAMGPGGGPLSGPS